MNNKSFTDRFKNRTSNISKQGEFVSTSNYIPKTETPYDPFMPETPYNYNDSVQQSTNINDNTTFRQLDGPTPRLDADTPMHLQSLHYDPNEQSNQPNNQELDLKEMKKKYSNMNQFLTSINTDSVKNKITTENSQTHQPIIKSKQSNANVKFNNSNTSHFNPKIVNSYDIFDMGRVDDVAISNNYNNYSEDTTFMQNNNSNNRKTNNNRNFNNLQDNQDHHHPYQLEQFGAKKNVSTPHPNKQYRNNNKNAQNDYNNDIYNNKIQNNNIYGNQQSTNYVENNNYDQNYEQYQDNNYYHQNINNQRQNTNNNYNQNYDHKYSFPANSNQNIINSQNSNIQNYDQPRKISQTYNNSKNITQSNNKFIPEQNHYNNMPKSNSKQHKMSKPRYNTNTKYSPVKPKNASHTHSEAILRNNAFTKSNYSIQQRQEIINDIDNIETEIRLISDDLENERTMDYNKKNNIKPQSYLELNSRNKNISYKPYTLRDYKEIKKGALDMPRSLGPNIGSDAWIEKKTKQMKANQFANQINEINKNKIQFIDRNNDNQIQALEYHQGGYKKRFNYDKSRNKISNKNENKVDLNDDIKELEYLENYYNLNMNNVDNDASDRMLQELHNQYDFY